MSRGGDIVVKYLYLCDGTKLSVADLALAGYGYEYVGSNVYQRKGGNLTLESVAFGSGRWVVQSTADGVKYTPQYHLTDHLGSTRVIVENGVVKERNSYYPFGRRWDSPFHQLVGNRYLYNGKEKQVIGGVNYLDYGARMYDSEIGRWTTQDPLAEKYYSTSPYVYVGNNPIRRVDPDGKKWVNKNGTVWDGKWTEHATSEEMSLGISLRSSDTGMQQFDKFVNDNTERQIVINTTDNAPVYGNNKTQAVVYTDGSVDVISSIITVFKKETDQFAEENNISKESSLTATVGHEIEYGTPENVALYNDDKMNSNKGIPEELRVYEQEPRQIKEAIIDEMNN